MILLIGHIVIAAMLLTQKGGHQSNLELAAVSAPLASIVAMALLRPVNGGGLSVPISTKLLDRAPNRE